MKRFSPAEMARMKETLYVDLARGNLDVREATRQMRKILGMTQKDYARKIAAISPRILSQFENGSGNPALATLEKVAFPFGLKVTFLPPESWRMRANGAPSDEE